MVSHMCLDFKDDSMVALYFKAFAGDCPREQVNICHHE